MKLKNTFFLIPTFLIASLLGKAQTIEYAYESLSTTSCNIFANATMVDNYVHLTALSRPKFSDESVVLKCKTNGSSSFLTTIYSINYGFKAGYNYKISVYYKGDKDVNDGFYPMVGLKISTTNGGTDANTNCVDPSAYSIADANTFDMSIANNSYAWKTDLIDVTLAQNANYLLVGAFPYSGTTQPANIFIRKIQIVETAPPVAFTLAPATLSITCGSATPQTFTVTNVHSTPGVIAYNWSLGAANGWIYNGSPAPATIQTSVNTLTLTPACQATHSGVSVSVTTGSSSYPADNVSTVTATTPVYSISGSSEICSGSKTYTLNNLPCNATVSWASSNPSIAPVTVSNNVATVTRQGIGDNFVTLTATITSSMCHASPVSVQKKNIAVGFPYFTDTIVGGKRVLPDGIYTYSLKLPLKYPPVSYNWRIPTGWTLMLGQGTNTIKVVAGSSPGNIEVDVTACGVNRGTYAYVAIGGGGPIPEFTDPGTEYSLKIFPNPAHASATITLNTGDPAAKSGGYAIREITITDKTGMVRKHYRLNNGRSSETIDISGLPRDVYTVSVFDGQNWKQARLSVQ